MTGVSLSPQPGTSDAPVTGKPAAGEAREFRNAQQNAAQQQAAGEALCDFVKDSVGTGVRYIDPILAGRSAVPDPLGIASGLARIAAPFVQKGIEAACKTLAGVPAETPVAPILADSTAAFGPVGAAGGHLVEGLKPPKAQAAPLPLAPAQTAPRQIQIPLPPYHVAPIKPIAK